MTAVRALAAFPTTVSATPSTPRTPFARRLSPPSSAVGQMNADLQQAAEENRRALEARTTNTTGSVIPDLGSGTSEYMDLLRLQIAMQRENQVFTAISNILKTRHETLKTIIGNIR